MPLGYGKSLHNPKLSWKFFTQSEPTVGGRKLPLPRGKTLGGSSSLNGMIYIRGHAEDFNTWANLGCTAWGWDDILPYFKKAESYEDGDPELHGSSGPQTVSKLRHHNSTNDHMVNAFREYGIEASDDFNGPDQEGVGLYRLTIKDGKRCSTAAAYLHPVRSRKNLTIITDALVTKVLTEEKWATGIEVRIATPFGHRSC